MKNCENCKAEVPDEFDLCWKCGYNFETKEIEVFSKPAKEKVVNEIDLNCLRCDNKMLFEGTVNFHKGFNWGLFGDLGHLFTGKKSMNVYCCPNCNKLEFYN